MCLRSDACAFSIPTWTTHGRTPGCPRPSPRRSRCQTRVASCSAGAQWSCRVHPFLRNPSMAGAISMKKAELARQGRDWEAILRLREQIAARGLRPDDPFEWLPFIEAEARAGRGGTGPPRSPLSSSGASPSWSAGFAPFGPGWRWPSQPMHLQSAQGCKANSAASDDRRAAA